MKTKVAILSVAAMCFAGSLMAQEVDDMYFTRKDREKLNATKANETTYAASKRSQGSDDATTGDESINPTDTYSARNTNPEYVSRSSSEQAATDNQDYYVTDYRNATATNLNKFNNNYNKWYNSSWYNNGYYGNSMYSGFNSPYYYNSFGNPWMSPYYQPGWGSSLSFYYGSPYYNNYGYNNYGYGGYYDPFYSPYYGGGYGSGFGMGYGMGYGSYYGGYGWNSMAMMGSYYYWGGRPTVVVVNNNSGDSYRGPVYGKRADRGGMMTTYNHQGNTSRNRQQTAATRAYTPYQGNTSSNGRVATTSANTNRSSGQGEYYNRSWRGSQQQQYQHNTTNSGGNNNGRSSWNQGNSNWNNNNNTNTFQHNNNTFTPSSHFNSGGGGSMRAPSSGGGLGGRTRGH